MTSSGERRLPERLGPLPVSAVVPAGVVCAMVLIRLPALFARRHLLFDDGVYGSSVLAMRNGARPFLDIFSPQGPLHLVMLRTFDLLTFRTLDGPRVMTVTAGIAVVVCLARSARTVGREPAPWLIGALAGASGSLLWVTGPLTGDGPAVAWACGALLASLLWWHDPSWRRALTVGLLAGAALATKAIVAPVGIVVGGVFLLRRRFADLVVAGTTVVVVVAALCAPFDFERVYDQSVAYHNDSDRLEPITDQATKLLTTVLSRDLTLLAVALGGLAWSLLRLRRRLEPIDWLLVAWLGAQLVVLVVEKTMFRNHIATLVPPLAMLAARFPLPRRALAAALVVLTPWWFVQVDDLLLPDAPRGSEAAVVDELRALPPDALVITDEPGLAWRAERAMPPWLVDASVKRILDGQITTESMADDAADPRVCAFVQWSFRYGDLLDGIDERLTALGYVVTDTYTTWRGPDGATGARTLWTRGCAT